MLNEYKLDIYTWPAMQGIKAGIRTTDHNTPEEAIAYLDTITDPYHHAVLQKNNHHSGYVPCDWNGYFLSTGKKWPYHPGTNYGKIHPDLQRLHDDYKFLIEETARIKREEQPKIGTINIAYQLLQQRHPHIIGWAEKIGWEAAGLL